jgi:FkbM family methyltransferase
VFSKNLGLNPTLAGRIKVDERPLWSDAATFFTVRGDGPATRVDPVGSDVKELPEGAIPGVSIDAFVDEFGLDRLDFIKMDIEGAEPQALAGSLASIRRFRPHLALCVYHHPLDFVRLAESIDALKLGYRFTLRHFTDGEWETVLFASAR